MFSRKEQTFGLKSNKKLPETFGLFWWRFPWKGGVFLRPYKVNETGFTQWNCEKIQKQLTLLQLFLERRKDDAGPKTWVVGDTRHYALPLN